MLRDSVIIPSAIATLSELVNCKPVCPCFFKWQQFLMVVGLKNLPYNYGMVYLYRVSEDSRHLTHILLSFKVFFSLPVKFYIEICVFICIKDVILAHITLHFTVVDLHSNME